MRPQSKIGTTPLVTIVVSVLLASAIWLVHNLALTGTDLVTVSVSAVSNIEGRSRNSINELPVVAKVRGTGIALLASRFLGRDRIWPVEFDSSDFSYVGGDTYRISDPALSRYFESMFNSYLSLESLVTKELDFHFQEENCRKVAVSPVALLSYSPQYISLGGVKLLQDSVTVYGEPSIIENIETVLTLPISHKDMKKSVRGTVGLEVPPGLRLSEETVDYQVNVVRFVELSNTVEVSGRNVPAGLDFRIYPATATLTLHCIFPCRSNPFEGLEFYIDYDDFAESLTGKCVIRHDDLPEGVIDYSIEPQFCECMIGGN